MKVHLTVEDAQYFDQVVELAKRDMAVRNGRKSGDLTHEEPVIGDHGFDGETFQTVKLGSWRITEEYA